MEEDLQKVGWVVCENDPVKELRSLCMQAVEESLVSTWPKALRPGYSKGRTDTHTHTIREVTYQHISYWHTKLYFMV